jgi:hypothetical protein
MTHDDVFVLNHDDVEVRHAALIAKDHVVPTGFAVYPVITAISVTAVTMRNGIEVGRDEVAAFDADGQPWVVLDGRLRSIGWCVLARDPRGEVEVRFEVEEPA